MSTKHEAASSNLAIPTIYPSAGRKVVNLYTYTDISIGKVVFACVAASIDHADRMCSMMTPFVPSKSSVLSVRVEPTDLPCGCIVTNYTGGYFLGKKNNVSRIRDVQTNDHRDRDYGIRIARAFRKFLDSLSPQDRARLMSECFYCGIAMDDKTQTRDHVYPRSLGGKLTIPACTTCNRRKGSLLYTEFKKVIGNVHGEDFLASKGVRPYMV